jgi:hypothetical protein
MNKSDKPDLDKIVEEVLPNNLSCKQPCKCSYCEAVDDMRCFLNQAIEQRKLVVPLSLNELACLIHGWSSETGTKTELAYIIYQAQSKERA